MLALRAEPNLSSERLAVFSPEEQFFLISEENEEWYYVETFDGIKGYVWSEYVEVYKSSFERAANHTVEAMISFGKQFIGTRYVYGGNSLTRGIDCSAFTKQVMQSQGYIVPRTAQLQSEVSVRIAYKDLIRGDLVFFSNTRSPDNITHVGIYLGDNLLLHSGSANGVEITNLKLSWYQERFQFGGRIIK